MLIRINLLLVLMTLNFFTISFGSLSPVNARFYGLFAFLLMVVLNAGPIFSMRGHHPVRLGLRIFGMLICVGIILSVDRTYVWVIWYVPLLYLFFDVMRPVDKGSTQIYLIWTVFVFAFCYALSFHSSHVWFLIDVLSTQVSRVLGQMIGTHFVLGPTGSGFWIFFSSFLCLFFAYWIHVRKLSSHRIYFAIAMVYLVICYFVYAAYGQRLYQNLYLFFAQNLSTISDVDPNFASTSLSAPLIFSALAAGVPLVFVPKLLTSNAPVPIGGNSHQIRICAVSGGLVLIGVLMFYLPSLSRISSTPHITFYGKGLVSWDAPQFGKYGTISSGMFGLLPRYLHSMGYHTRTLKEDVDISAEILKETDTFVVINLDIQFSDDEQKMIWKYVEEGGSLLVLGDHTDIEGTMKPLNHLLEPVNIKFRFDSAFTATRWFNAYELFPHSITAGLDYSNDTLQHSTGASLNIVPPAVPIVNAKFAFSDKGNYENANGYLGDYLYQPGEKFGDLTVVAGATYGKGKVIVFGDTSGFQNLAIAHSHELINRIFCYLTLPVSSSLFKVFGLVLLFGVLVAYLLIPATRIVFVIPIFAIALGTGVFIGHALLSLSAPVRPYAGDIAYVDAAHINQYSLRHWEDDSIDGLMQNLARNGYIPLIRRGALDKSILSAKIYVVIAPNKSFTLREQELLKMYIRQGGLLILAVGWEEKAGAQSILNFLGLDIVPIPLGPVPLYELTHDEELIQAMQREPQFMEAWPISYQASSNLSILYGFGDYPTVVHKRYGKGGAIVIADTQFLYNRTLEAEKAWWEGNIIFFKQLLDFGISGGAPE